MSQIRSIKKGVILQDSGELRLSIYRVKKGLLRSYFADKNGKEHNFMFAPEGWILADLEAVSYGEASKLTIEALENSEIEVLAFPPVEEDNWPDAFMKMSRRAGALQRRVLMMMSSSALERYEFFLKLYPNLNERIKQRHIASYLGITPQALSKIRAQRVGKVYGS
jgi:CRP-like cAMP-binding protein